MKRENNFNLQDFINDLLYRYDLVIIPEFGAIIGRRKPARYHSKTHLFSPPYKDISFNSGLTENDGLLVSYVAGKLHISHSEAMEKINEEVQAWKHQLQEHKRLILENIGIFSLINEKIIFQAILNKNFLPDSYGLTSFIKTKSSQTIKNMDQQDKNLDKNLNELIKDSHKGYKAGGYLKYAAVFVLGIALLGGGLYIYNSQEAGPFQKASFMVEKELPPVKVTDTSSLGEADNTEQNIENKEAVENEKLDNTALTEREEGKNLSDYTYQIIVGGFRHEENAEHKVQSLLEQGYNAQIIGQNKRGLYMVSIDADDDLEVLKQKLPEISQLEPGAWIYRNR